MKDQTLTHDISTAACKLEKCNVQIFPCHTDYKLYLWKATNLNTVFITKKNGEMAAEFGPSFLTKVQFLGCIQRMFIGNL